MIYIKLCEWGGIHPYVLIVAAIALCIAVPYLIGSFNFGVILSNKIYKDDVRRHGSGNAGSTNMLRNYGTKAAALTFVGDAVKTAVACYFGLLVYGVPGVYLAGLFCMMGHMFPVFYRFKGGKGVVCFAVMLLITDWRIFLALFAIFLILVIGTKFISLGSVICAMVYPVLLNRMNNTGVRSIELIAILVAALIVFMHRENIKRLLAGTENKLSFKKKS